MTTPAELARTVAEDLRGTCQSLDDVLTELDQEGMEDNAEFTAALDQIVFCCTSCSWWCEISEMAEDCEDDWICEDCS